MRDYLPAREAAALLGVKLATLYSYTSRGQLESVPGPRGRGRWYARASLERLKARHDARAGHAAVAAGALRFGEPTLETSVSEIRSEGPYYRGQSALALCERGLRYEEVFDLLISREPHTRQHWTDAANYARNLESTRLRSPAPRALAAQPSARLAALIGSAALSDARRHVPSERDEQQRARRLVYWLASHAGGRRSKGQGSSIAERVVLGCGVRLDARRVQLVDRALGLCADHELNASTFVARVTASTGADLYACLGAAFHALSGPRHGGASAQVEALLRELEKPESAGRVVSERLARGEHVPGFGHPLYPKGDPRAVALLALAAEGRAGRRRVNRDYERMRALCAAMERAGLAGPNLDAGLVALRTALDLPRGSAAAVFAVGRIGGWVAHALEQRRQPYILRPRSRYVPPANEHVEPDMREHAEPEQQLRTTETTQLRRRG